MKSIIRDFAKVCYALLFLISTKALAQEKLQITKDLTNQIVEKYGIDDLTVFPVARKEIEYKQSDTSKVMSKRLAYMVTGVSIKYDSISGTFIKLPDDYRVALVDIKNKFVKDEAFSVIDYPDYNTSTMSGSNPLIQKIGTEEYYYIMSEKFIKSLIKDKQQQEIFDVIHKLGFKEYKSNDRYDENLYIKSKTSEIKLDSYTYNELKKNPNYITLLDNDQIKIASLVKQTMLHSKTLDRYLSLYNIKRSKMSSVDIKAWRTATTNANKLNEQIYKLNEKYEGNYSFTLLDKSSTLDTFLDNLNASKGVLGM